MLSLVILVAVNEWKLMSLSTELSQLDSELVQSKIENDKVQKLYSEYVMQEKRYKEAENLLKNGFSYVDFMAQIGRSLPAGIVIKRVDFRGLEAGLVISGDSVGVDAQSSDRVTTLVQAWQNDEYFSKTYSAISLSSLGRNMGEGVLSFELFFKFKAANGAQKSTKAK